MNPSSTWPRSLTRALLATATALAALLPGAAAQAASLPTLSVSLSPTSITVGGAEQSGAVNVVSTATAGREPSPGLLLLKPGVTPNEIYALLAAGKVGAEPNLIAKYASIVFDGNTTAGKSSEAQTVLEPGVYVALNAEGSKSSVWPHTSFTVTAAAEPAALPTAQATERSIDFGFRGASTLHDGELVRFENAGYVVHMDLALPVKGQAAAKQLIKALRSGDEKHAEKLIAGEPVNFAGPLSSGGLQQSTITAKPGIYVQVCFMSTQDGRSHSLLGMEREIKVAK
jgi:hypothetical protein